MNILSSILGLSVISIFWIISLFKLSRLDGGIAYFFKHLSLALLTCFGITLLFFLGLSNDVGLEIILFIFLIALIDMGVLLIWSIVLYIKTVQKEKEAALTNSNKEGYEDILDDLQP